MRRITRAAGRLAVAGAGCVLSLAATAGQLSFAPSVNLSADDDSNRYLAPQAVASRSTTVQLSADLNGSTEATAFTFSPLLRYQAFDSSAYANIFERIMKLTDAWTRERLKLTLTGEDSDRSTLTTELTQTGILSNQLHQRLHEGGLSATFDQTERVALIVAGSYSDVSYYGGPNSVLLNLLSGYRYPSGSIGEQIHLSETSTLQANITYSKVLSQLPVLESRSTGADLDYHRSFSDTFDLDATIGASQVRSASTQHVTTGSLTLTRKFEFGSAALSYTRGLTPYGTGELVQRQVFALSASHALTDRLEVTLSGSRVQNDLINKVPQQFGQLPEVQTYDDVQLLFTWQFAEYWHLNADVDGTRTHTLGASSLSAHRWGAGLSLNWTPLPRLAQF